MAVDQEAGRLSLREPEAARGALAPAWGSSPEAVSVGEEVGLTGPGNPPRPNLGPLGHRMELGEVLAKPRQFAFHAPSFHVTFP